MASTLPANEPRIGIRELIDSWPDDTPAPDHTTVRDWMLHGVRVGGRRVRLAATRRGVRWFTTEGALRRFLDEVNQLSLV
jgi:hypothetical protein